MSINGDEVVDILVCTSMAGVCKDGIDAWHEEIVEVLQHSHHFIVLQIDEGEHLRNNTATFR